MAKVGGGKQQKKGAPALGEERRLTEHERKKAGMDAGVFVRHDPILGFVWKRLPGKEKILKHDYGDAQLKRSMQKLKEFWSQK